MPELHWKKALPTALRSSANSHAEEGVHVYMLKYLFSTSPAFILHFKKCSEIWAGGAQGPAHQHYAQRNMQTCISIYIPPTCRMLWPTQSYFLQAVSIPNPMARVNCLTGDSFSDFGVLLPGRGEMEIFHLRPPWILSNWKVAWLTCLLELF